MYAVVATGGKQLMVAKDDVVLVEKLDGAAGDKITFKDVLVFGDGKTVKLGAPLVAGATVAGEIIEQTRGEKVIIFKKKRRQNYRRKNGHTQHFTKVRITGISLAAKKT